MNWNNFKTDALVSTLACLGVTVKKYPYKNGNTRGEYFPDRGLVEYLDTPDLWHEATHALQHLLYEQGNTPTWACYSLVGFKANVGAHFDWAFDKEAYDDDIGLAQIELEARAVEFNAELQAQLLNKLKELI